MPLLLILDSLGTSELMLILGVALIFFGPRKLPQISRQIGKSLAEFRKASEDFKSTWAREVQLEVESQPEPSIWNNDKSHPTADLGTTVERSEPVQSFEATTHAHTSTEVVPELGAPELEVPVPEAGLPAVTETAAPEPARKADWL